MNVFIIHSGSDKEAVERTVADMKKTAFGLNALVLGKGGPLWKIDARRKIGRAQLVVFFVGESSHKSPYIAWEIKEAIRREKRIVTVFLDDSYLPHPALNVLDSYSGQTVSCGKRMSAQELSNYINEFESGECHVINGEAADVDKAVLLEQYKLFLQTSESLVERRQGVNNFYITVNSAMATLLGVVLALEVELRFKVIMCIVLAVLGIVLSASWIKILMAYGNLNSSKMKIISDIEKHLPASLYDAEWAALSNKLNKKRYVSFTDSEKRIPWIFIAVYAMLSAGLAVYILLSSCGI